MSGLLSTERPYEEFAAPKLLGGVWNWCLYGVLVVQFYVYSYNFPRDSRRIKLLVYSIFFLETVQTALSGADLYYWFAAGFDKERLVAPFASPFDLQILEPVVSLSVQFFFVYRVRVLSRLSEKQSRWLWVIICLLSVIGGLGALTAGILSYERRLAGVLLEIPEITWIVASTLSDLLITSAMLYHLRRVWARDGHLSNHVLVSIVRLTIETNLVTTFVSIVSLVMIAVYSDDLYYFCPTYVLGKLYSNTLLVSLNNRISIRDVSEAREVVMDRQVVAIPYRGLSEVTRDTIILEAVKAQEDLMKEPVTETEVEERVNSPATEDIV
ncbi:hypothetical protein DFH94DRAFT_483898 [Russula ochroleuca]|jgi:hypothetical protein|uniref:DUF6534 domain-containing protein n=1 Tax=Russula ochroleuca TaxID=152965 RepID=A0A9P5JTE5_9AGAM|nr:hypothetical protein DFH94DRAFT_483898 [Russula ochroleuca]